MWLYRSSCNHIPHMYTSQRNLLNYRKDTNKSREFKIRSKLNHHLAIHPNRINSKSDGVYVHWIQLNSYWNINCASSSYYIAPCMLTVDQDVHTHTHTHACTHTHTKELYVCVCAHGRYTATRVFPREACIRKSSIINEIYWYKNRSTVHAFQYTQYVTNTTDCVMSYITQS